MSDIPRAPNATKPAIPSGGAWNSLRDKAIENGKFTASPPLNISKSGSATHIWLTENPEKSFVGIIASSGFTDERYTVDAARPSNDGDAADAKVTLEAIPSADPHAIRVTATNFNESGTHFLAVGTKVMVHWDYDKHSPNPTRRYWFFGRFHGITDSRFNAALGTLQFTYSLKPPDELIDSDWVNKVTFLPFVCPPPP